MFAHTCRFLHPHRRKVQEQESIARLERAEREVESLRTRAGLTADSLRLRRNRNHWREAIERMVRGD